MIKNVTFKLLVTGMAVTGVVSPFLLNSTDAQASTNGKTASNAISWVKSKVGSGIDYDGLYGRQCVDLIKAYYNYLGAKEPRGNGADYSRNTLPSGWKRYAGVQPKKGDILVYTGGYGGYGHVAIYESDYSTYHQNFSSHSYVERVTYKYNGNWSIKYWGVIRPDFATTAATAKSAPAKNSAFTGVKKINGIWTYVKNDMPDYTFTGAAKSTKGNWVFVRKGKLDTSFSGVAKSTKGNWIYMKNGRYYTGFTGVAKSTKGNWVYVKNGRYYTGFTGVAKSTKGHLLYIVNGRWKNNYSGKYKSYTIKRGYVV